MTAISKGAEQEGEIQGKEGCFFFLFFAWFWGFRARILSLGGEVVVGEQNQFIFWRAVPLRT